MPAIGCVAVVKPVSALCQTRRGCSIYDCFAADRRQASSYRDCDHFQTLVKSQGRRQQPGRGVVLHGRDGTPYALPCRSWLACDRLRSSRKTGICAVPDKARMQHLLQGLRPLSDFGQKLRIADSSQVAGLCCTDAAVRPWALPCRSWLACDRLRSSRKTGICAVPDKARVIATAFRSKAQGRRQQPGPGRGQRQPRLAVIRGSG